jgi:predicted unusual protein kinase regulating ubiquinone biosynthesis (AarF/ABC1/UbiB family)
VAAQLGDMKGAVMKLGQLVAVVADDLPSEARAALARLQQDVPPMAPGLAEEILRRELGTPPGRLFADWDPEPVAAASIGQVPERSPGTGGRWRSRCSIPGWTR